MNRIGSSISFIAMMALICVAISSCDKGDDTYYNYETKAGTYNGNALSFLESQTGIYDSMLLVINRLKGIKDSIANNSITLFAMSNRSFTVALESINRARRDSIPAMPAISFATMDSAMLDTFFCRYVITQKVESQSLEGFADGLLYPSLRYKYNMQMQFDRTNASGYLNGGPKTIIFSDPKNSIFFRYWVRVNTITVDIKTTNAIVNILPPGHDFGFGDEFIRRINKR